MSYNDFLSITGNTITIQNINTNDVWNITVIDANFMLSKYNGRGTDSVNIIPFPNIGDGIYGDIVLSVNNNPCFKGCVSSSKGEGTYFNVSPKYVTLHNSGDTYDINISSDCTKLLIKSSDEALISASDIINGISTITSNTDKPFENNEVIVTNECNGLQEIVYVSQKPLQSSTKSLTVNPQYIYLTGEDKEFKIKYISICNGETIDEPKPFFENGEGLSLEKDDKYIYGTITASTDTFTNSVFTVNNECGLSKDVYVNYSKEIVSETYICIDSNKDNCTTSTTYNFTTEGSLSTSYTINSSSNWYISTYDSNKVNCSKSGNNIIISLGNDRTECENEKIILKNKDGNKAIINYSVGAGLDVNDNIIFTFADGSKELNLTANTDYSVSACVIAYKNDNGLKKPIKWVNNSSGSFKSPFNTYSGGTDNCVNVEFTALPIIITTQSETTKEYTITLQEQETYKTIKINVSVTKQCENNTIWTGLTVTASDMGKCETTSSSIKVTANGVNTNDKCESGETSTTISNYDVIYNPSGTNETEISREILITVIGKGDYINASGETIVTQASGPCTPPPAYEEVYEWDRLIVSGTNMDACDDESILTIIAEGTKTNSDGTDEDVEENISIERCTITYEPSGANETEGEREVTITIEFEGVDEEITVIQAAGPCSCEEKDVWTSITVSSEKENIEACDEIETLDIITVTAHGEHIGKDCNSATTSTTLSSSDYTITYTPNDKNQTNSEREISINVVGKGDYSHLSESTTITQSAGPCNTGSTASTCMNIEYSVPVSLSSSVIVSFKDNSGAIIAAHTVPSTTGTTTKEICGLTNGKALTASCSDDTVTMSGGINFNFSAGTTEYITIQAPNSRPTGSTVYEYTFKNCYSDRQISLFASNATPSGSHLQFAMLSALDGTAATVLVTSNNGTMVNGSSSNSSSYAKIGDSVKVYSVTNTTNIWTLEETITLTASNRSFEYGCSSTPTSCTCSTVSISCNPTNSYTTGNSVSTVVTVNAGSNCSTKWKAYSSSGSYLGEGESGKSLSRTTTGTVTFRSDACTSKTTTWTISKPECAKPTIRLSGSGDAYMLQNYSETDEWCGTNPNVSVSTSADYIGDGSDYTHYSPTTCSFQIANCAASITSFNLDSGGWILDSYSGLNSFGISFTIRPDAIVNATCTLSGTFTYLMQGTPFSGTFSISIQFNG